MGMKLKIKRKRHKEIEPLEGATRVKVGFPEGEVGDDILERAVYNHYGTSRGIPSRPFLLNAVRANQAKYKRFLQSQAKKVLSGETSQLRVLDQLGVMAEGDVKKEITRLRTPPNAPSTIKQKGSSNPLIDTGEMRASVTYVVDEDTLL